MAREYKMNLTPKAGTPPPGGLTDDSPMPWGKHKGVPMKDVPASYLLYMWDNEERGLHKYNCPPNFLSVKQYIMQNFSAIASEFEDAIIVHDPRKEKK